MKSARQQRLRACWSGQFQSTLQSSVRRRAALGHGLDPKVLDDPVITAVAERDHKTPAQVALDWAVVALRLNVRHPIQCFQWPSCAPKLRLCS